MKRFKKIYIETTNICNLDCSFCPKTNREKAFMSVETFEKVIEKIKPFTDHVYFHVMGEPLLNPNLEAFLKCCHEAGIKVNLTTNGTLLTEKGQPLLENSAMRQINISLSSFEANTITKNIETYLQEVCNFIKKALEKGIICSVRLWNMDTASLKGENQFNGKILNLLETYLELPADQLASALLEKNSVKIAKNLYLNMAEKFEWPDLNQVEENQEVFCYGLRDQIGILVDGTVVPCCLDSEGSIPLGNILTQSLNEIIEGKRAVAIYDGFSNRRAVESLCKKCGYAAEKH